MKTVLFSYGPKNLHLYYNGAAMFAVDALDEGKPEDQPDVLERMQQPTAEGFGLLCKVAVILATQGELCRRYLQYAPARIPTEQELLVVLSPTQLLALRSAVIRAINAGFAQAQSDSDGDVDTGLAELEKKTTL